MEVLGAVLATVLRLTAVLLLASGFLAGCGNGEGPNDPHVSGADIKAANAKMMGNAGPKSKLGETTKR